MLTICSELCWYKTAFHLVYPLTSRHKDYLKVSDPLTGLGRPLGNQKFEAPRLSSLDSQYMNVVNWSAVCIGRLYPPGDNRDTHFCYRFSRLQVLGRSENLRQ
jgi:hypothetical protein